MAKRRRIFWIPGGISVDSVLIGALSAKGCRASIAFAGAARDPGGSLAHRVGIFIPYFALILPTVALMSSR